jgi:hypothetical protein
MYPTVELPDAADGRLEGIVTTESHRERRYSGMLDVLRIFEDLEPSADSPVGDVSPPRWPQ